MPGNSGAIRAGRAYLELFADKSKLVRTLKSAARDIQKWGASVTSVGKTIFAAGAAITTPILGMVTAFTAAGSAMVDMSARTGATVEELSTLKYAAEQSGASMEEVESGMRKGSKAVADAAAGSKSAAAALKRLGVSAAQLKDLTPDEQLRRMAQAASEIPNQGERAAAVMGVMGKSATSLLPLMSNGAAGIAELQQQARELGLEMSTGDAAAAESFGDMLDRVWSQIKGASNGLVSALIPALMEFATTVSEMLVKLTAWIRENRGLVVTIFKVGAALVAGGAALMAFGTILSTVGAAVGLVAAAVPVLGAVIGAILSPIGLAVAAIAAVAGGIGYLLAQTEIGQAAFGKFGEAFGVVAGDFKEAWGGIVAALSSGDIGAAAGIAWNLIKLEFERGIAFVKGLWHDGWTWLKKTAIDLFFGLVEGLSNIWSDFQNWFTDTLGITDPNSGEGEKTKQDRASSIRTARDAAQEQIQRDHDAKIVELTKALEKSRADLKDSVGSAKAKAAAPHRPASLERARKDAAKAVGQAADPASAFSLGTFNGATASQALSSQGELDRIAAATEETAKNTRKVPRVPKPVVKR